MEGTHAAARSDPKRLLLISNSTQHGGGYLDHVESEIREFLGAARRVLFVPFALFYQDAYAELARARFERLGTRSIRSIGRATFSRRSRVPMAFSSEAETPFGS